MDGLTEERLDQTIGRLLDAQSVVKEFLVGFSHGEQRILELVLVMSFFVFKAYEAEYPCKPPRVKREDFESIFDDANAWMHLFLRSIGQREDEALKAVDRLRHKSMTTSRIGYEQGLL